LNAPIHSARLLIIGTINRFQYFVECLLFCLVACHTPIKLFDRSPLFEGVLSVDARTLEDCALRPG